MINDVRIIHIGGHISCIQNAAKYGHKIQECRGIIFEHSPGCGNNRNVIIQMNTQCIYQAYAAIH